MRKQTEQLFSAGDARAWQENRRQQVQEEIAAIDCNRLLNTNVEDLVAYFAEKYALAIPELETDHMLVDHLEAHRELSGGIYRPVTHFSGSPSVTGTEIALEVPFTERISWLAAGKLSRFQRSVCVGSPRGG